jgi:hypothetical protein
MNPNYKDFTSIPVNSVLGTSYKSTVTLKDIAHCKGESQTFFARAYYQLKSLWKNHTFVTNDMVNDIMKSYGIKNIHEISSVFKEAIPEDLNKNLEHQFEAKELKRDLNIASDLTKIFGNSAKNALNDPTVTISKENKLKEFSKEMANSQIEIQKAQTILQGKKALEKYNPLDLLRAANFEVAVGFPSGSKGIKIDFIDYINQQAEYPKNKEDLERIYSKFIDKSVKNATTDPDCLNKMKDYVRDKPMNFFFTALKVGNSLAQKLAKSEIPELEIPELFLAAYEKKIMQSSKVFTSNSINELLNNTNIAMKTQQEVNESIHGIGVNNNLKEYIGAEGKKLYIPQQALLDIPRSPYISLNNCLVFNNADKEHYTIESYYHSLHQALEESNSATNAILVLTTQGMFAHLMNHILSSYQDLDITPKLQQDFNTKFQFHINIEGDKVKLTLKNAYNVVDDFSVEGEVISIGRCIVKTEITLSLNELKSFDPANQQTNLKTVEVSDTFSPIIHNYGVISGEKVVQRIFNQF